MNMTMYVQSRSAREWLVAGLLFVATVLSSTFAGFLQQLTPEALAAAEGSLLRAWLADPMAGVPFSATLLGILLMHELGHFFAARHHRISVSLPYFIPAPTLIGTFGAVIRMRGILPHRRGLLDVGAAGPLVGFVIAVPAYAWGLAHSQIVQIPELPEGAMTLGDSLLTALIQRLVVGELPPGGDVLLHPVAFAAWIGLFVTSLNLIPMGQFDGGHVLFAARPQAYPLIARLCWSGLLIAGAVGWRGWWFWALIAALLGVTRHPWPAWMEPRLDLRRMMIALACAIVFVLTFIPEPFRLP